eukprot:TRINITY_DN15472_c1_g1_i1.p2 TRINITY_DN15472_c1_g1~~TRINITY_DN15472_c1_g1_i1.p2  ORF type:complete len:251 (-),score=2.84 TRINITY_DN15472_c1_g1_i1:150-902(-)
MSFFQLMLVQSLKPDFHNRLGQLQKQPLLKSFHISLLQDLLNQQQWKKNISKKLEFHKFKARAHLTEDIGQCLTEDQGPIIHPKCQNYQHTQIHQQCNVQIQKKCADIQTQQNNNRMRKPSRLLQKVCYISTSAFLKGIFFSCLNYFFSCKFAEITIKAHVSNKVQQVFIVKIPALRKNSQYIHSTSLQAKPPLAIIYSDQQYKQNLKNCRIQILFMDIKKLQKSAVQPFKMIPSAPLITRSEQFNVPQT